MSIKKRDVNIDLVKCVAVFSVLSVHFFLNTDFYDLNIDGFNSSIMIFFRTLFMICVPLFLITTGYLMKNKKLNKKYYLGIVRVLIIYTLCTVLYILYDIFYLNTDAFSIKFVIKHLLSFDVGYCWYIEMYIGLFIIIPFLNLVYNNLESKKQKGILVFTMLMTTSFQGLFNIKHFLIPDWWINIYPITYYFIGCYINEYKVNIKKIYNICLVVFVLLISTFINYHFSNGTVFVSYVYNSWGSIFNVLTSSLIFIFIINLNLEKINKIFKRIIVKISELSLGMYLSSAIVDKFIYKSVFKQFAFCNMKNYFIVVPLIFILAISVSMIINFIYKIIDKNIIYKLKTK